MNKNGKEHKSLTDARKKYLGKIFTNNIGLEFKIISYDCAKKVLVQFNDGFVKLTTLTSLTRGAVKNPYNPSVNGKGYHGIGKYKGQSNGCMSKVYGTWRRMFDRCYGTSSLIRDPSYAECSVCEDWLNFQVFGEWFDTNYIDGYELDKDLIIKGNKIYSPETCCFIPQSINSSLTKGEGHRGDLPIGVTKSKNRFKAYFYKSGVRNHIGSFKTPEEAFNAYKVARESYIKEVAEKYKDTISTKAYQALLNYKVEITD